MDVLKKDVNGDGKVDNKDDLNKDGKIDGKDIAIAKKNGVFDKIKTFGGADKKKDVNGDGKVDKRDDINGDGKIDGKDVAAAKKNGKDVNGDGKVDQRDDLNGDGKIDGKDIAAKRTKDVNGDGKVDQRDDLNGDGKIDGKDVAAAKKNKKDRLSVNGKGDHKELKGEITKETFAPNAVLVEAFTADELYLELQWRLTDTVDGPIKVLWSPATGALEVDFKTAGKASQSIGVKKTLTPTKQKDAAVSHGAHYHLKYTNLVTEIGIDPKDLPYSFVSGRDADPFVRIINGMLYIRLALEEGKMADAEVLMNINEKTNVPKKQANGTDPVYESEYAPEKITVNDALLD